MEHLWDSKTNQICGYLEKKSSGLLNWWKARYFTLKNRILTESLSEKANKPTLIINFDQISVGIEYFEGSNSEEILISISGSAGFRLRSTGCNLKKWVEIFVINICESQGVIKELSICDNQKILKYTRLSNRQFLNSAQNGDVLLFRSKEITAKIQRKVTFSKYDHVAIILRYEDGNVAFLESTSQTGVQVVLWEDFIDMDWHLLYDRLVFRKLKGRKHPKFTQKLSEFVQLVDGKKYSLNPTKLFTASTPGTEQSFFCSELIASAYKFLNILPHNTNSSSYLPVHFSEKKKLLLENFSLGPECLIDFSLC